MNATSQISAVLGFGCLCRGTISGGRSCRGVELVLGRLQQLLPGLLELVDPVVLQRQEHVAQVDTDRVEFVEYPLGRIGSSGDGVSEDHAVVRNSVNGLLRHGVHGVWSDEFGDVDGVGVVGVFYSGRRPQWALRPPAVALQRCVAIAALENASPLPDDKCDTESGNLMAPASPSAPNK